MTSRILAFALTLGASTIALAQAMPPDEVRLHDGTYLRGTIVERSPTQLVVMLPTGETRTYPAEQVASAGPAVPAARDIPPPPVQVLAPPGPPMATLRVRSDQPNLSLQQLQGTSTVSVSTYSARGGVGYGTAQVDHFGIICNAPCETEIPAGTYQLGVAQGTANALRAGAPIDLRGEMDLQLRYDDRSAFRVAGWVTFGLGVAGGTALLLAGLFVSDFGYDVGMVVGGSVLAGVSIIVYFVFAFMNDGAYVDLVSEGVRF